MTKVISALTFLVIFISGCFTAVSAERPGWVRYETSIPYSKMIKALNTAVKAEKMLLVSRASASSGAKRRKIKIPGNMVVGVYRNDYAIRMLAASVEAGIEAPIRFYITENEDGSATLSYKTPSYVFSPYFDTAKPELAILASELDTIFAKIAERAISAN
ncbi:MAG: DUF302 domain-containing protein [Rhizobiaceae bacterium]